MGAKTLALGLIGLTAGIYFTPLCTNLEMLVVNSKLGTCMCSMEACCEAEAPETNCCELTTLVLERRDAVSTEAPVLPPLALASLEFPVLSAEVRPAANVPAPLFQAGDLSPPPLSSPLRL
ncbi:MAG: hypothetical protein JSV08_05480 [Acidobacteriota bacterium]|nr:MAG: hypothetical protein JSV08_05480 [Acidobacteriota bacterium]